MGCEVRAKQQRSARVRSECLEFLLLLHRCTFLRQCAPTYHGHADLRRSSFSQRGLSGINIAAKKKIKEGTATAVNIHRQPYCPFHDWRINSAVAPLGTGSAISQLTICAAKIPTTMVN